MERITVKRPNDRYGIPVKSDDNNLYLYGDAAERLAAYEDIGLTPEELNNQLNFNKSNNTNKLYTANEAFNIINMIDAILVKNDVRISDPIYDDHDEYRNPGLYGEQYDILFNQVEEYLIKMLEKYDIKHSEIIKHEFSTGND